MIICSGRSEGLTQRYDGPGKESFTTAILQLIVVFMASGRSQQSSSI